MTAWHYLVIIARLYRHPPIVIVLPLALAKAIRKYVKSGMVADESKLGAVKRGRHSEESLEATSWGTRALSNIGGTNPDRNLISGIWISRPTSLGPGGSREWQVERTRGEKWARGKLQF
jgi:hypothetical protein